MKGITKGIGGEPAKYSVGRPHFQWCCDCKLRHVVMFNVEKTKDGISVVEFSWRDDVATDLRRSHERAKKRKATTRKKKKA